MLELTIFYELTKAVAEDIYVAVNGIIANTVS
jgi:hypothetical protein